MTARRQSAAPMSHDPPAMPIGYVNTVLTTRQVRAEMRPPLADLHHQRMAAYVAEPIDAAAEEAFVAAQVAHVGTSRWDGRRLHVGGVCWHRAEERQLYRSCGRETTCT